MIQVKEAVANAFNFLRDIYGGESLHDIRLEEVEQSEDGKSWRITLSFLRDLSPLATALGKFSREYKVFSVDAATGAVQSMKIRQLT